MSDGDRWFHYCPVLFSFWTPELAGARGLVELQREEAHLVCPECGWETTVAEGAVVLLSGGLDSSTCLASAAESFSPLYAISFRYGQRHSRELDAARAIAEYYRVTHIIVDLPLALWGGSALTDARISIPTERGLKEMAMEIPVTYVPGRNLIFLALAASVAEAKGISTIFTGMTQVDYSGYPDCRKEFLDAVGKVLAVGTKAGVEGTPWEIKTPLLFLGKKAIIQRGLDLGVPYGLTWSCYLGGARPCGTCDSCKLRAAGFAELGIPDPGQL